jgi:endonuclease III related protein
VKMDPFDGPGPPPIGREPLRQLYQTLLQHYGPQGWWPLLITDGCSSDGDESAGYHPGDYTYPRDDRQRLEICIGAVLTQNTAWKNVISALRSLANAGLFSLSGLLETETEQIALAIRSAGYYNQKACYLKNLAAFIRRNPFARLRRRALTTVRSELLSVKGIGPETADAILLYALGKPCFVVDTYSRRILSSIGLLSGRLGYEAVRGVFEAALVPDPIVFQEYHALLVVHGKQFFRRSDRPIADPLLEGLSN